MANTQKYQEFMAYVQSIMEPEKFASFSAAISGASGDKMGFGLGAAQQGKLALEPKPEYLGANTLAKSAANVFMPQVMQASNAPFQTGQNALRGLSARAGMMESPFALAAQAGLHGQQAGGAQQEAMQRAIQLGQAQASAQTGGAAAINAIPPQFGYQMLDPLKQSLSTYAAYRGFQTQGQQPSPYTFSGQRQAAFQVPNPQQYMPVGR